VTEEEILKHEGSRRGAEMSKPGEHLAVILRQLECMAVEGIM
jgi:hypothetical protein